MNISLQVVLKGSLDNKTIMGGAGGGGGGGGGGMSLQDIQL